MDAFSSLPRAIAYGLCYDPSDQLLAVGTHGRGAWTYSLAGWPQTGGPGMALDLGETTSNFVNARLTAALSNNYTTSAWVNLRSGGTFPNPRVAIVPATNCGASAELLIRSATTIITILENRVTPIHTYIYKILPRTYTVDKSQFDVIKNRQTVKPRNPLPTIIISGG